MKDNILQSDEEDFGDEVTEIEEEEKAEQEHAKKVTQKAKPVPEEPQNVSTNTYEAFSQPARLGIVNTSTGEVILEGFTEKDTAIAQLGSYILNKLNQIAIASGV